MSSAAAEKSNRNGIVGGRTPQRQTIEPGGMGEWRLSEPNFAAKDFIAPTLSNPLGDARIGKVSPRRVRLRIGRSLYRPRYLWYRRLLPFRRVGRLVHVLTPLPGQAPTPRAPTSSPTPSSTPSPNPGASKGQSLDLSEQLDRDLYKVFLILAVPMAILIFLVTIGIAVRAIDRAIGDKSPYPSSTRTTTTTVTLQMPTAPNPADMSSPSPP
jgi:hypothetical protein